MDTREFLVKAVIQELKAFLDSQEFRGLADIAVSQELADIQELKGSLDIRVYLGKVDIQEYPDIRAQKDFRVTLERWEQAVIQESKE